MTEAMALTGHWSGVRAYPRGFRTPDTRRRLETALERLQHHHDRFARHAARASLALARIDGLRTGMIDQLDAIDAPSTDLEPNGDDENSLCGVSCGGPFMGSDDLEDSVDDHGEPDADSEASLSGQLHGLHSVGSASYGIGSYGELTPDLEQQCEDEGHDSDREPAEHD